MQTKMCRNLKIGADEKMNFKLKPQALAAKLRELAKFYDSPELHAIWPQVWMLEDRPSATAWMEQQKDEQLAQAVVIYPVVYAPKMAIRYGVSSVKIGNICRRFNYSLQMIGNYRCWVAPGTKYPRHELFKEYGL
jgi:hypothetical protein